MICKYKIIKLIIFIKLVSFMKSIELNSFSFLILLSTNAYKIYQSLKCQIIVVM